VVGLEAFEQHDAPDPPSAGPKQLPKASGGQVIVSVSLLEESPKWATNSAPCYSVDH